MTITKLERWLIIVLLLILAIEIPLCSWFWPSKIEGERRFVGEQEIAGKTYLIYERVE